MPGSRIGAAPGSGGTTRSWTPGSGCSGPARCLMLAAPRPPCCVTLTLDQVESRTGLATTAHGGVISVPQALRIAAEADIVPVVLGDAGGVLGYGLTRRTASPGQRRALAARDGGCTFPGCDRPPDWCETHHVTPWVRRRLHRPGQSHFGLRISPSRAPQTRLDLSHHQRRPVLATTTLARLHPNPAPEHHPPHSPALHRVPNTSADLTSPSDHWPGVAGCLRCLCSLARRARVPPRAAGVARSARLLTLVDTKKEVS